MLSFEGRSSFCWWDAEALRIATDGRSDAIIERLESAKKTPFLGPILKGEVAIDRIDVVPYGADDIHPDQKLSKLLQDDCATDYEQGKPPLLHFHAMVRGVGVAEVPSVSMSSGAILWSM